MFIVSRLQASQPLQASSLAEPILLWTFCGERLDLSGDFAGPRGLVRALIVQLLISWPRSAQPPNLDVLERVPEFWFDVRRHHTNALCQFFQELLLQLPPTTKVFCISDGISRYETEAWGWEGDLLTLVQCLRDCVYDAQRVHLGAVFKCLLTSAEKSISAIHYVGGDQQVDLRTGNYHDGSQDFDSLLMTARGPASQRG